MGQEEGQAMSEEKKELTLEENFARLEEIIGQLEDDGLPLEKAFQTYTEGMLLLEQCSEQIDRVEKQVRKFGRDGQLEEFEDGDDEF